MEGWEKKGKERSPSLALTPLDSFGCSTSSGHWKISAHQRTASPPCSYYNKSKNGITLGKVVVWSHQSFKQSHSNIRIKVQCWKETFKQRAKLATTGGQRPLQFMNWVTKKKRDLKVIDIHGQRVGSWKHSRLVGRLVEPVAEEKV